MKMLNLSVFILTVLTSSLSVANENINIRTNPFMILGSQYINLEADVKVTEHWTVGPTLQVSTIEPLYEAGLKATYFEKNAFEPGWMTASEVSYLQQTLNGAYYDSNTQQFCNYSNETLNCSRTADQLIKVSLNHGYFWRWDHFNLGTGLGAQLSVPLETPDQPILQSNIYFSLGWLY